MKNKINGWIDAILVHDMVLVGDHLMKTGDRIRYKKVKVSRMSPYAKMVDYIYYYVNLDNEHMTERFELLAL